ncbi:MAG: response regulator [Desulfosalsimonadaceae bacterium]
MLLFNPNAINNLLLFILLFIMIWYFIIRSKKNLEVIFLIVFIIQLVLWQLCFLVPNIYFGPAAAYPLYYFLNSGYTVFSYLALVMFSYYFVTPVFKRESQIVFISGLIISIAILIYSVVIVFPGGVKTVFDPVLHVYEAEPSPHRKIILFVLLVFIIITTKNLVYKICIFRGDQRAFALHLTIAMTTGIFAVVGVSLLQQYVPIHPNIHNTINTYLAGFLFIYFYLVYLSFSGIPFLYSDKTVLLILFIMILISSMTTSLTFLIYERDYVRGKEDLVKRIALDMALSDEETLKVSERLARLYGDEVECIILRDKAGVPERVYFGSKRGFTKTDAELSDGDVRSWFHAENQDIFYSFETPIGAKVLHVGVPYIKYRKRVHEFVLAGLTTVLTILGGLFIFMRFVVLIGLTRPLKRLLAGVREIRGGNLDHRIEISAQDEIGFVARQFNLMVDDLRVSGDIIKKSESKFRELTGMLPDIIYETDLNLHVTYFNKAGFEITGFGDADLEKGLSLREFIDEDEFLRLRAMLDGKGDSVSYKITTHQIRRKNGEIIFGENNAAIIYENDLPVGLRGVIRDVTEKIRIENSLIQAQKMETIGTLAGGIAHDFNNILTGITGTVSLLEFKIDRPGAFSADEVKKNLNILKKSANRAADMVNQLLALSRHQKPVLKKTDLAAVAVNVYEICKNSFDKKIQLNFNYPDDGVFAMADETQMGQVLLNLCVNARDSMTIMRPEGEGRSGELSVFIEKMAAGPLLQAKFPEMSVVRSYCRLRVRDTGVGMGPETISRIFDPFFTTKQKGEGTGLGLAMVYNIVKQHGGVIDIDSRVSAGTTIDVYIPAADAAFTEPPEPDGPGLDAFCGTLLLVDDDPIVQKTCSDMLTMLGCSVITAMDGRNGVDVYRARQDEIDAVILDVVMPVMSGNEVFDELKKINPEVRVLVSSGFREDSRIDEMLKKGARSFIQKPYTINALAEEISRILMGKNPETPPLL